MFEYFYSWTPLVIVGAVLFLALPWLGPVALLAAVFVALLALATLAWAIVAFPYKLGRAIAHRWHARDSVRRQPATLLTPASPQPVAALSRAKRLHG